MKDFLGRSFKLGDYIVYPGRRGSYLWTNLGVVVGLNSDGHPKVRSITSNWSGVNISVSTRTSLLIVPDRATILSSMQIPNKYYELLQPFADKALKEDSDRLFLTKDELEGSTNS
jgi:hypothetical protein